MARYPILAAFVTVAAAAVLLSALRHKSTQRSAPAGRSGIGPGSRVLHIGDSHTVGIYGTELDRLLRAAGATVETYGSSGSAPSWWIDGHPTTMGWVARHADGTVDAPSNWKAPHPTPKLGELVATFRPSVVIISLGANLRPGGPTKVRELVEIAASGGAKVFWVGPPNTAKTAADPASDETFYAALKAAAGGAAFIDSRPFTPSYAGTDGLHFSGSDGSVIAKAWADGALAAAREYGERR